ncbi:ferredoxin [Skermania sp. ID1734]|uniref:ferredoxin n=1 Tax=Skermania sp. ID1734 TaxID=2597516 RepID=UPI001181326D|nr:ferredoxin [Skermania sp. ID1734]TSD96505.1 ferredoxin [Skermania sp. ID1734]
MEIKVDREQCEANGVCVGIAPDIFELDDNDELHIAPGPLPEDRLDDAKDAVAQCPKAALRLQQ